MIKNNHTGKKIALGALIVGATGYLIGILTAPKSGKETREDITNKASDVKQESMEQLQSLRIELEDLIQDAKDKRMALSTSAREEFNEAVIKAKDAKNKTTTMIRGLRAGEADDPELNKAIKQARLAVRNLSKYYKS